MSSNSPDKLEELKHIASIVRALITSIKPPCYLRNILREYNEVESKQLPYKSLGYKTAQELLEDTGEFIFNGNRGGGDIIISAKPSRKTAHIASMVRGQKTSKSSRIAPLKVVKQPPRMLSNRTNGFGGDRNNNNNNSNNNRSINSHQQLQRQKSTGSNSQNMDLRDRLNSIKNQKSQTNNEQSKINSKNVQNEHKGQQTGPRPILGASKPSGPKEVPINQDVRMMTSPPKPLPQSKSQSHSTARKPLQVVVTTPRQMPQTQIVNQNNQQQPQIPHSRPKQVQQQNPSSNPPASGLASRLQQKQQPQALSQPQPTVAQQPTMPQYQPPNAKAPTNGLQVVNQLSSTIQNRLKLAPEFTPREHKHSFQQQYNPKTDGVSALIQYCRSKNYQAPHFSCMSGKFSRGTFTCCVHVNGVIFSRYPLEYESEYLAKEACAIWALEKLKMQEKKRPQPSCTFSDTELLDKLYTELLKHPHGIFVKNLPEWFETTFAQSLPEEWWSLIQTSSLFTIETGLSKEIIFANKDADKDFTPLDDKTKVIQIDPICLPWSEDHWSIIITHCSSTVEIWGRLFGAEYSNRFGALMNDIDVYMASKKERPVSITRKNIYLVWINDSWHRVRVEELDKSKGSALCFFIDFGDADWLFVDQLMICESHFLKLPAQAVPFCLYGLEDFEGNPYARKCLDDLFALKSSVIGKIFTKESEFYDTSSKFHGKIQVVLYDTSKSEVDINLNQEISNIICQESLVPDINRTSVTNIYVTHINDNGDIFVQVKSPDLLYIQNLLQKTVDTRFKRDQHRVSFDDLKRSTMFLVCDDDDVNDVKWYRATLAEGKHIKNDQDKFLMYFVDQGITKSIDISKIFQLEKLSLALSKFPNQAIRVRLHNIPDITNNIVARIRGLLPKECGALTKMVVPGPVPLVTIHTRLEGLEILVTINDVIRNEHELLGDSDLLAGDGTSGDNNDSSKFSLDFSKPLPNNTNAVGNLSSPTTPTVNAFIDITQPLLTTVPGSPQKVSDLPKLKDYSTIPPIGGYFEVRITMSANPSNFIIQPYKDYPNLGTLMKELQIFCENSDEFIPTDMVEIGEAYAAKNADGFFHRVIAVKKYGDMIHVRFCDFGDTATVDSSQLKILPLKFRHLPKMAIQAKLYGIKAVNGDWALDDCLFFRKLTVGKTFVSVIKNIKYDQENKLSSPILEMELIDVSSDDDVLVHELLLDEQRATTEC
ncbi:tudor domain-containing protein 7 tapas [Haematobia irritans]|uniref:tudor domain-containing protein 7 tapas n=1 Tax=Haematobia irritans TaxID=7368 RepID=UPI003F505599